ncbi:MAG TPA: four helix bundle protein [Terriglobia bacterium]|nr:four helix bundle protein [Terriglobia bacterium]
MNGQIRVVQDLRVYQQAKSLSMAIFALRSSFPREERYALTDQVLRSSRSVCANLAEAWQKRMYRAAFVAKLSDSAGEASETTVWLEFAHECGYITDHQSERLEEQSRHITASIVTMLSRPDPWLLLK